MKIFKKQILTAIYLVLMLTVAVTIVAVPNANAQIVGSSKTYAFIGATPNPATVGQEVLLHLGITRQIGAVGDGWEGLTVTVTKPDGDTDTLGPYTTDSTGGTGDIFVPDMEGEYTFQTHFPAQWFNSSASMMGPASDIYYEASDSEKLTLTVQQDPLTYYPGMPLPTEYWTRPIDAQAREWYAIAGNWPYAPSNMIAPYNDAPETAHILWTKPLTTGGLVGGDLALTTSINQGPVGMETGDAYQGKWSSRFILMGKLYYADAPSMGATIKPVVYHCVDLHTGEELWTKTFLDNRSIAFAQAFYWENYNYQGSFAYLWVTTGGGPFAPPTPENWTAFDAFTGDWRFTVLNVPLGITLRDPNGGLYKLQIDQTNGWMAQWNLTNFCISSISGNLAWGTPVYMQTFDAGANTTAAKAGWDWNVTIPTDLPGSVISGMLSGGYAAYFNDRVIGSNLAGGIGGSSAPNTFMTWGLSLKEGEEGQVLFDKSWASPSDWITGNKTISWAAWSAESKVGVLWSKELRQHYGVSFETGDLIWGPTESEQYLNALEDWTTSVNLIAYGNLYTASVSGIVYCYNATTGDLQWTYSAVDQYHTSLWSNNWWLMPVFISDGKIYIGHTEHSANQPLPRGAPFTCLNTTNGDVIWRVDGLFQQARWGGQAIIGDSIIATMDTYDQRLYAIGKGPSATSVTASPKVSVHGSSVLVEGMVTDISPGTTDAALAMRFPNGVPAVSDANMSDWMLYVYKQFERPADVIGVDVTITVLDPNGNCYDVATATSDANGFYSADFTPSVPGKYTVYATFSGSESYYGSSAQTAINVEEAPAPTAEPTPTPASMTDMIVTGFGIGMIVAIVAIGLVIILMLRKR